MPDETRAIEPSLTTDEWKQLSARREVGDGYVYEVALRGDHISAVREYTTRHEGHTTRDLSSAHQVLFAPLMALANAALPDGDPRKITREQLRSVQTLLDVSDDYSGRGSNVLADSDSGRANALLAALAAILPPEGVRDTAEAGIA